MEDIRQHRIEDNERHQELERLMREEASDGDRGFDGDDDVPFYIPRD